MHRRSSGPVALEAVVGPPAGARAAPRVRLGLARVPAPMLVEQAAPVGQAVLVELVGRDSNRF